MSINLLCCTSSMESGGSQWQMLQLLQQLDRQQFSPHLYLTYRFGPLLDQIPNDVTVDAFASRDASRLAVVPGLLFGSQIRKLRWVVRQRKIQVSYDRLYHTVMLGAFALRNQNVARVITVVSPPSRDFGQSHQRWMAIKRKILSWSYRTADTLLAVSEESAQDAADFYAIPIERWQVIPSPVDVDKVQRLALENPPADFRHRDGFNIAIVGRLSSEKNHKLLFEVIKQANHSLNPRLQQCHLHVVGDGTRKGALVQIANNLQISNQVSFYGVQTNPYSIISRCDCLCLPSTYEDFPNVVMEAMACGIPVIASDQAGGLKPLIGNRERGVLVSPHEADLWLNELESLAKPCDDSAQRVANARAHIKLHHDLPKWVSDMQMIFQKATNRYTSTAIKP